jgi:hypothetical protein
MIFVPASSLVSALPGGVASGSCTTADGGFARTAYQTRGVKGATWSSTRRSSRTRSGWKATL